MAEMAPYRLLAMTGAAAYAICRWRHPPPYDLYDFRCGDEEILLAPELAYHRIEDAAGRLCGFACFGEDARVIGGRYSENALDIGLGMRPDRTGRGEGYAFVAAILEHGRRLYGPMTLRLSVAAFNERAASVYRRLGFSEGGRFPGRTRYGVIGFRVMTRPADDGPPG